MILSTDNGHDPKIVARINTLHDRMGVTRMLFAVLDGMTDVMVQEFVDAQEHITGIDKSITPLARIAKVMVTFGEFEALDRILAWMDDQDLMEVLARNEVRMNIKVDLSGNFMVHDGATIHGRRIEFEGKLYTPYIGWMCDGDVVRGGVPFAVHAESWETSIVELQPIKNFLGCP